MDNLPSANLNPIWENLHTCPTRKRRRAGERLPIYTLIVIPGDHGHLYANFIHQFRQLIKTLMLPAGFQNIARNHDPR
jgi:hypothetical protein